MRAYATSRPVVRGTQGIVAAGHPLTAMAGMRMLLSGGNAFDAAVAAGLTANVVEPTASFSLAAEGSFMVYHAPTRRLRALSGQGVAPGRATVDFFKEKGLEDVPAGPGPSTPLAFTVPGVVDAYILLLETYGTKTLGEVMAPAIDYAGRGFPMYPDMCRKLGSPRIPAQFRHYPPGGMEVFYPGGRSPEVGRMLVQRQLAATLEKLALAESQAPGHRLVGLGAARETFYRGEIARTIVQCSDRVGGLLGLEDLAGYHARFDEPVGTTFMGHELYCQSVWSQGPVVLQALNILEHFDLGAMGHNSARYIHTVTEALKLALADRDRYYGDPDFCEVPVKGLLSKEYAAARAGLIRADVARPEPAEAGDPWRYCGGEAEPVGGSGAVATPRKGDADGRDNDDTTYFTVLDRDGSMVCATVSGGPFAKSVFFPELGCTLSIRSEMFYLDPGHPNCVQPGKRPRTTLTNYIVTRHGQPVMTVGCPGGDGQVQAALQLVLNVMVFGMELQQAVEEPRFASQSLVNSFYPHVCLPGQLVVHPGLPAEVCSRLATLGHRIEVTGADSIWMAGVGAIVAKRDPETGAVSTGADPREESYAAGW